MSAISGDDPRGMRRWLRRYRPLLIAFTAVVLVGSVAIIWSTLSNAAVPPRPGATPGSSAPGYLAPPELRQGFDLSASGSAWVRLSGPEAGGDARIVRVELLGERCEGDLTLSIEELEDGRRVRDPELVEVTDVSRARVKTVDYEVTWRSADSARVDVSLCAPMSGG